MFLHLTFGRTTLTVILNTHLYHIHIHHQHSYITIPYSALRTPHDTTPCLLYPLIIMASTLTSEYNMPGTQFATSEEQVTPQFALDLQELSGLQSSPNTSPETPLWPQHNQYTQPQNINTAYPPLQDQEIFDLDLVDAFEQQPTEPVQYPDLDFTALPSLNASNESLENFEQSLIENEFALSANSPQNILENPQPQVLPTNSQSYMYGTLPLQQPYMHGALPQQQPYIYGTLPQQFPSGLEQQQQLPAFVPQQMLDSLQQPWGQQPFMPQYPQADPSTYNPAYNHQMQAISSSTSNPVYQTQMQDMVPTFFPAASVSPDPIPVPEQESATPTPQPQPAAQRPAQSNTRRPRARQARRDRPVQKCDRCEYSNSNREEIRRHIESVHLKIRRFPCGICDAHINDASGLSKHKKSIKHRRRCQELGIPFEGNFLFECPECRRHGKESRNPRPDQLKRHLLQYCEYSNHAFPAGFHSGKGGMNRGIVWLDPSPAPGSS